MGCFYSANSTVLNCGESNNPPPPEHVGMENLYFHSYTFLGSELSKQNTIISYSLTMSYA